MRIGVIGINHRQADLKVRETLAKICHRKFHPLSPLQGQHLCVLLSTCNRTELYFRSEELGDTHSALLQVLREEMIDGFDQKLYSFFGLDCFYHLSRVTSGLDSAIVAETEIQGQVKKAYDETKQVHPLPPELHFLFQNALKVGKRLRQTLLQSRGMPDLEHAVYEIGAKHFDSEMNPKVLFVGASAINKKIIGYLKSKGVDSITICNRTEKHAVEFAEKNHLNILSWDHLNNWPAFDWVVLGTSCPSHIIENVPSHSSSPLIMDLCVPRNVDPEVGTHLKLMNIDQINETLSIRRNQMLHSIRQAEIEVKESAKMQLDRFLEKERKRYFFQTAS